MDPIEKLLDRNKALAKDHQAFPLLSEVMSGSVDFTTPRTIVLTCADPRCSPEHFLGLQLNDGVIVIRNTGGHVTPEITSILALDHLVDLENLLVIHHTDCGTLLFKNEEVKETVKSRLPTSSQSSVDEMDFGAITDVKQSVLDDLDALKRSEYVRKELAERSRGFIYDIKTGLLEEVKV